MADREVLGQVIRIAYLKAMGGGPELIAFAQSRDDDPETRQRWHQIADAVLSYVEPPADPYAHLTRDERQTLAIKARDMVLGIALTAGQFEGPRFDAAIERSKRWQAIADGLEATNDRQ